jgi:hypothetical protein
MPAGLARFRVPRRGSRGPVSMPAATSSPADRSLGQRLFRVSRYQPPPRVFRPGRPTRVSCPHRGVTRARPLHPRRCRRRWECVHSARDIPSPATFRPRAFSAPRRFSPRAGFAGLFHPATTSRACSCSRASSPPAAGAPSSRVPCPLAVARSSPDRPKPTAGGERPRLRGVAPRANPNGRSRPFPSSGFLLLRAPWRCRQ